MKCVLQWVLRHSHRSIISYKSNTNLLHQSICTNFLSPFSRQHYKMQNQADNLSPENCNPCSTEEHRHHDSNSSEKLIQLAKEKEDLDLKSDVKVTELIQEPSKTLSKRALKRQARANQFKESKRRKKAEKLSQTGKNEVGYNLIEFDQTSYYFENGLRKVYPYRFVFATYAKGRWVGRTLKSVLEKEFGFDDPEDLDKAFNQGRIHANKVQVSTDYVVQDCDFISHQIHRHENPVTDSNIEILADTDEVVVINKPSSIPCHPCGRYRFNSIVFILGKEMGYCNLRNIYRLDRLTSGVLVLGKTDEATKRLEDQVVKRQVQKEYVCRVQGQFPSDTITVDQPLQPLANKLRLQIISTSGKSSQTTFTRLSYNGKSSVVKCIPHTGRTHQIRVHLQYLGHPILNDVFYNSYAWGSNKGKGGNYQVSHDTVCSRILKDHQATQWDGGENPLFYQKLKEMEEKRKPSNMEETDTNVTKSTEDDTTKISSPEPDTSNPPQNEKITSHVISENESKLLKENNGLDQILDLNSPREQVQCERIAVSQTQTVFNASTEAEGNCSNVKETSVATESGTEGSSVDSRIGFDWTKWNIDPSCDLCRKTTIDPKPKNLVMFLHAVKYKGPGWEYQTKLPDWAQDDWTEEEDYVLEDPPSSLDCS